MNRRMASVFLPLVFGVAFTVILLALVSWGTAQGSPAIRYIAPAPTGSDSGGNDCTSSSSPCASFEHAISVSNPGDELHVAGGTYTHSINITGTAFNQPVAFFDKPLKVIGGYDSSFQTSDPTLHSSVLDAGQLSSVVVISNVHAVELNSLTLTGGNGSGNCPADVGCGGGIYAKKSTIVLNQMAITANVGSLSKQGNGGGIFADSSDLSVFNSLIRDNIAHTGPAGIYYEEGGGIYAIYSHVVLDGNRIEHNTASTTFGGEGGGLFLYDPSEASIINNEILGNNASSAHWSGDGGGIYIRFCGKALIAKNNISGNWTNPNFAGYGGGVTIDGCGAEITQNIIFENHTQDPEQGFVAPGGGLNIASSEPVTVTNNLFFKNHSTIGSGIYVSIYSGGTSKATIVNNTFSENDKNHVAAGFYADMTLENNIFTGSEDGIKLSPVLTGTISADTNLFWDTTDSFQGMNAIHANPFLNLALQPMPGSPALDTGKTIPWLTVDLVGSTRPQGPAYDLGAFEGAAPPNYLFLPLVVQSP